MNHERGLRQIQKIFKICYPSLTADITYQFGFYHIDILNEHTSVYNPYNFSPIYRFIVRRIGHSDVYYDVDDKNIYQYFYNVLPNMVGKIMIHSKHQYTEIKKTFYDENHDSNYHIPFRSLKQ